MIQRSTILIAIASTAIVAPALQAQETKVAIKQLSAVEARSARSMQNVNQVRALSDGSVIVNDGGHRQILRFDASLQNAVVIADSTSAAQMPYGQRQMGIIPYLNDSTLIIDPATTSFVVLNGQGKVSRVMAPPRTNDINMLAGMNLGSHAFDTKGRLVYRENAGGGGGRGGAQGGRGGGGGGGGDFGGGFGGGRQGGGREGGGRTSGETTPVNGQNGQNNPGGGRGFTPATQPDSVPLVRVDFDTRKADTVTFVKVPRNDMQIQRGADGSTKLIMKVNPLPQSDDWALMSDGTIAVIRTVDYHIDWYAPDGSRTASEKLPFDWKRITDDDKTKLVDSLSKLAKDATDRMAAATQNNGPQNFRTTFEPLPADRLPDYYPSVRQGTSLADFDGNIWLLPATSAISAQIAQEFAMGGRGGPGGPGGRGGFGGDGRGGDAGRNGGGAARGGRGGDSTNTAGRRGGAAGDSLGGRRPGFGGDSAGGPPRRVGPPLVYDVVNRKGELVERVQLPADRTLLGFGPKGTVFLAAREGRNTFIEKYRRAGN